MNEDKHMKFVLKQEMKAVTQYHNILIQNMAKQRTITSAHTVQAQN